MVEEKLAVLPQMYTGSIGNAAPPHVIMNGITDAALNEIVITMDGDKAPTGLGPKKILEPLEECRAPSLFL